MLQNNKHDYDDDGDGVRERHQYLESGSIPNKCEWSDSPQPSSNLVYGNTPLWTAKCIFPSQTNLHTTTSTNLFHVLFGLPFFLWPSTSKSNTLLRMCPSSLLNIWPYKWTLFAIVSRSIEFVHEHQICIPFSVFELYSTHCFHHVSLSSL